MKNFEKKIILKSLDEIDYEREIKKKEERIIKFPDENILNIDKNGELEETKTCLTEKGIDVKSTLSDDKFGEEEPKAYPVLPRNKIGRNQLCPCKSGKKYKHCCINKKLIL